MEHDPVDKKTTVADLAQAHASAAIGVLVDTIRSPGAEAAERMRAAEGILKFVDKGQEKSRAARRWMDLSDDDLLEVIASAGAAKLTPAQAAPTPDSDENDDLTADPFSSLLGSGLEYDPLA